MRLQLVRSMLVALGMLVWIPAADAAPSERDKTKPLLLIHGYQGDGTADCDRTWGSARDALYRADWQRGRIETVGYYSGDTNCSLRLNGRYGRNAGLRTLGRALALKIYREYSRKGQSVDIIGHSMGGLIARTAVTGVQQKWAGYPKYLRVEDAVTLGTPHRGVDDPDAKWVHNCNNRQCVQMRPGSTFLRELERYQNPQAMGGTDWTLIGSASDGTVRARSATKTPNHENGGMRAGHYVGFTPSNGISHGELRTISGRGSYGTLWRHEGGPWQNSTLGRSPVLAAGFGVTYSRSW